MPRYAYRCLECKHHFDAFHGFSEKASCPACDSSECERALPVGFSVSGFANTKNQKAKVGDEVNRFIKEAREDLKQQRRELREER